MWACRSPVAAAHFRISRHSRVKSRVHVEAMGWAGKQRHQVGWLRGGNTSRGNTPSREAISAIAFIGRNHKLALFAHLHAHAALVPPCTTWRVSFLLLSAYVAGAGALDL